MLDFEESVRVGTLPSGFFFSFFGRLSVLQSVLEFHQVLKTEQGEHTIVVSPQGEAFGFRYTDIQTEYNRIYQLFEQPEIKNHDDFWQFMEGQLLDGLYWEYWYNDGDDK